MTVPAIIDVAPAGGILPAQDWAGRIVSAWQASIAGILEAGRLLAEAKAALPHGAFLAMVESELPFGARTAQRLMAVSADTRLATHGSHLPADWRTLYEITRLDDSTLEARLGDGTICPEMQRRDIAQQAKKDRRARRETQLAARQQALPDRRFGVVYADPEWRFEPYSRETGMDRAPDNHYPTSDLAAIAARDVARLAADDCVLFLWGTVPMLPLQLQVMSAWGFGYVSHLVWKKVERSGDLSLGTGYWFRNAHELLLVGTRGGIPAPAPGTQWPSLVSAPVGPHSEKPALFAEMIGAYFPNLPKVELNARPEHFAPGDVRLDPANRWTLWGNEADG